MDLTKLIKDCEKYINAIYRVGVVKMEKGKPIRDKERNPIIEKMEWKITSSNIPSADHHDKDGKFRFNGDTLEEALDKFYKYLKKNKKI